MSRKNRKKIKPPPEWYVRGLLTSSRIKEYFLHLVFFLSRSWLTVLVFTALFTLRRVNSRPIDFLDWAVILMIVSPALIALWAILMSNVDTQAAGLSIRGSWDDLLNLMPKLHKKFEKAMGLPLAEIQTAQWTALALARLGRQDEAIECIEQLRHVEGVAEADYLVTLITHQGRMNENLAARNTAQHLLEIEPERMEGWVAICEMDAIYFNDPQSARIALDHAMTLDTFTKFGPITDYIVGVTLAAEGDHAQAIEKLEEFRTWARSYASRLPTSWTVWAIAGCVMAQSLHEIGQHTKAESLHTDMRAQLEAGGYTEVLYQLDSFLNR
jgi:tetratricopeptide (TPR) repeat protein